MRLLLDTHVLIWMAYQPERLTPKGRRMLHLVENELVFSVVSLWEIGVKRALGRKDFNFDPHILRGELLVRGFRELQVTGEHALAVAQLPELHRDPFDRLLLCQALVEGLTLLSNDDVVLQYPVTVLRV